jgi:hypothetical protein
MKKRGVRNSEMNTDKKRGETHMEAGDERKNGRRRRLSRPFARPAVCSLKSCCCYHKEKLTPSIMDRVIRHLLKKDNEKLSL